MQRINHKILTSSFIITIFLIFTYSIPASEAHILVIADNETPSSYDVVLNTAAALQAKGYNVLELYGANATTENIVKGMYNADAVIYGGHGGYMEGNYNGNGGLATPPFGLVGNNGFIWGIGDKMREGDYGNLFQAPFKKNIPVILFGACFSSGWVDDNQVSNPIETIYDFSQMFTGAGANYYATNYVDYYQGKPVVDIVDKFLNGASNFGVANQENFGVTITQSTIYNGQTIWHNTNATSSFVGNWNGVFPQPNQTAPYNATAADAWYNGFLPAPSTNLTDDSPTSTSSYLINLIFAYISTIINYFQNIAISNNITFNNTFK